MNSLAMPKLQAADIGCATGVFPDLSLSHKQRIHIQIVVYQPNTVFVGFDAEGAEQGKEKVLFCLGFLPK